MSSRLCIKHLFRCISPQFRSLNFKRNEFNILNFTSSANTLSKGVAPQQPIDLLMQNIKSASDTSDVLYNIQQHHAIMNDYHVMNALNSIFVLQKSQNSTLTNSELIKHDSFQLLCKILTQKIRYLELHDHFNCLKVLSFVGVPSTSKIIQILLQLISKRINDLTLQQIVFLDFVLKGFDPCPLVEALKIALPIVFEAHFRLQSDVSDMKMLTEFFVYAIKKKLSDKCIDLFVSKITENKNNLDVESCKIIVRTLCEAKRFELPFRNLLHQSLDNIVDDVNKFTFLDLNYILARLTSNFSRKYPNHFYHEEFIDSVADYVVKKKCDTEQVTWVLKSCNKFRHMNKGVMDYICETIVSDPLCLDKWSVGMIVTLLNSLSISDYRPDGFSVFQENIVNNLLKFTNKLELPWLRVALDLCVMNCWPHNLFDTIFEKEFLDRFLRRGNAEDLFELLQLYQAVVVLCPSYRGNLPSVSVMQQVVSKIRRLENRNRSTLLPALIHGLGGPAYVLSPVYTKLGHFIDHMLVMRKGGYSVSINKTADMNNDSPIFIEDLQLPEDTQIMLVLFLTQNGYTLNTERILGNVRLNMNTLETMGFSVVPVIQGTWENLLEGEKIPFIMQALQNKCQDQESIAASHT